MDPRDFLFAWILLLVSFDGHVCHRQLWHRSSKLITCHQPCGRKESNVDFPKSLCSCSQSCVRYGDCCYDSPWKNKATVQKDLLCLPVEDLGYISVVNACPRGSTKESEACDRGLSSGLPVTSLSTGTSYANIHCAQCNEDADELKAWPVDLKCCSEYNKRVSRDSRLVFTYRQKLWSMNVLENGTRIFCECKLLLREEGKGFMDTLELRNCQRKEISTCSFSWKTNWVKRYCTSYLDPIYSRDKMYRNKFCAFCNYESPDQMRCTPEYQDIISTYGLSHEEAYKYCNAYGLEACLDLLDRQKGRAYSFSRLFKIEEVACIPPEDRLCCEGERYDFRSEKCRKVLKRNE